MASTTLPNGIIVPEKFSRDWYADLYHNWQELDNLLGASGPGDGTLTIQKNGDTVGTFSANQATDETINIEVPDVNNGTLTIQQNGTTVDTFTANSSSDKTVNISVPTKTSDLNNDSGFITGVSWNDVADKPSFATVATSGSYTDLSDKPTIPTVNNGTLAIQQNGATVDTFSANSSSDKTVNIQCVDLNSNQTVGGIKTFSNAPVVGSIDLDGKTIDTDANGDMTYDSHIVDTIEEQGNGYIRYLNGLQICWTNALVTQSSSGTWTYPKTFISIPCIWWQATGNNTVYIDAVNSGDVSPSNAVFIPSRYMNGSVTTAPYGVIALAIGRWK
jgi:hypothetical protein